MRNNRITNHLLMKLRVWRGIAIASLATLMWVAPTPTMSLAALTRVPASKILAAAIHKPSPQYPMHAKRVGAQGQVEVDVTVAPDGSVKDVRVVSGHMMLRETARTTASQWKFDPEKLSAASNDVIGTIVFTFKINN